MSNNRYRHAWFAIGRNDEGEAADVIGFIVRMPVGSVATTAIMDGRGVLCVGALVPEGARVEVDHPVIVAATGQLIEPMMGRRIGEMLGMPVPVGNTIVSVFKDLPWPTSTLEAVAAKGNG